MWSGDLIKAGIISDGVNIDIKGVLTASNLTHTAGDIFYVHSSDGENTYSGKQPDKPFKSILYALTKCTASTGNLIFALPGHVESIIAAGGLDLNIAGVNIIFLGYGSSKAKVEFTTDVGADLDVSANGVTLVNPKFVSGIDALTGPIDINAANFRILNGEYHDAAGKAATDCIVGTSAAIGLTIDGWKYFESTTGTQKQSNIQLDGVDNLTLKNIDIRGDFATGNIENVTDEILNARLEDINLDNLNATPKPAIVLDANATGYARNVKCRVASGTTYVSSVGKINWDSQCEGFNTDGGAGEPLGTATGSGVEGKLDTITDHAVKTTSVKNVTSMTTANLFTVAGGPVKLLGIVGHITTVIQASANNTKLVHTPTGGAAVDLCAVLDVTGSAVRKMLTITGTKANAMALSADEGVTVGNLSTPLVLAPGTLSMNCAATTTGVVDWYIVYKPMAIGATMTKV
jgi:hypothetical protein